jgi:hypothetical protein
MFRTNSAVDAGKNYAALLEKAWPNGDLNESG